MADKPCRQHGPWTLEALHIHFEARLADKVTMDEQRFEATKVQLNAAFASANEKAASHNDLIAKNERSVEGMMPRAEYTVQHKALDDRIARVEERQNYLVPREEATVQHKAMSDRDDRMEARILAVEVEQLKAAAERAGQMRTVVTLRTLIITVIPVISIILVLLDRFR